MLEGFHDYRSPFDVNQPDKQIRVDDRSHEIWINLCDYYAESGRDDYLNQMLSYVTLDNPPPAKDLYVRKDSTEPMSIMPALVVITVLIGLAFVIGIACTLIASVL